LGVDGKITLNWTLKKGVKQWTGWQYPMVRRRL